MTIQEIAERLTTLCRNEDYATAQKELFADDAISIEPEAGGGFDKETKGLKAILEKGKKFSDMVEQTHETIVSEPLIAGKTIAFVLTMDATMKGRSREKMTELCVYQVKDSKIVSEQFFM